MDVWITHWINAFAGQSPALDLVMIGVTQIGIWVAVAFVALQWWSVKDRVHVRHAAICAGLAFLVGLAINQGFLLFIHRVRPYDASVSDLLVARSSDWSFPSDHATASTAIAVAFAFQKLPRRTLVLALSAFFICLSRIFVGTHYLTDILGGAATGAAAAVLVYYCYREDSRLDRFITEIL